MALQGFPLTHFKILSGNNHIASVLIYFLSLIYKKIYFSSKSQSLKAPSAGSAVFPATEIVKLDLSVCPFLQVEG